MHGEPVTVAPEPMPRPPAGQEVIGAAATVVRGMRAYTYVVPTTFDGEPTPEADGTATWDSTGVLVVEIDAGACTGLGYAYGSPAALGVVRDVLAPVVLGRDVFAGPELFWAMAAAVRNLGWRGIAAGAISAIDVALHDAAACLLEVPLLSLLGSSRDRIPVYGSGGFTGYSDVQLRTQLQGWVEQGVRAVKIKVGRDVASDIARVRAARDAIGRDVELFVDANGAYDRVSAIALAERFADDANVTWFEEPVSSDDIDGLRSIRDRAPTGMRIAAGEYGYTPTDFRLLLDARAVDVLQADATRCGGVTGFGNAAQQCVAAAVPLSAHTAPALHASLAASAHPAVHVEYFHDHALIEPLLFDGVPALVDGCLVPDTSRPGHGMRLSERGREYRVEAWRS